MALALTSGIKCLSLILLKADILRCPDSRSDNIPPTYRVKNKNPPTQIIVGMNYVSIQKLFGNFTICLYWNLNSHVQADDQVGTRGTGLAMRSGSQRQQGP